MTITTRPFWRLAKLPLAVSLASTLASPAFAVNFNIGEIEGQFDSALSVGASWSTAKADKDLIGANNGGRGLSQTSDDGRLNFKRGETFSKIFKGIHDLELRYGDTGVFVRGKYWYDFELKDEGREFKDISDSNRKEGAKSSGGEILDAFVYHNYAIADQPGTVRLGRQVVSWGESTFLQNSINSINPVDVAAFRRPGAEVKEALIPVNMFYVSQSLTDRLSMEAFYQIEWDQTITENCGTFFSQVDIISDGCDNNLAVLSTRDTVYNSLLAATGGNAALANGVLQQLVGAGATWGNPDEGVIVRRHGDQDARDSGQWGVAFRYLFEPLDTEFGAYFMNYHSRAPIFSGVAPSAAGLATANAVASALAGTVGAANAARLGALPLAGSGGYFAEYPEDIRLYGLSFSTTLPTGTAWSGEISYRPNAPVQLNSTDVLYAGLKDMAITVAPGVVVNPYGDVSPLSAGADGLLHGYNRKEITQIQTTFTHFFDQVMGASRLTLVGEIGWTHVGGLESTRDVRYGRDPVFGSAGDMCVTVNTGTAGPNPDQGNIAKGCDRDGFTTSNSWGYRTRAIWEYPDVIAGVNFKPNVAWSHDVKGYSPGPGGNFEEGRKAISLGLDAEYQNTYTASLAYTDFFDGKYSTVHDRDFISLSFGMNF
ncbi:DUF1302 domain-containing protein [Phytopseudomonas dryadis]|uniref:DUF1302 domain-containing protein n=1 Tax=Phytopseudomonas dryadis TaxID=2487520 RepID=A0A4Q9QXY8_9GAMM|nr:MULTISPECIES: DUF1302 domain-containing protein [Pseudomonas]TBU89723.1 DUF1302 domain-containing protein [Pseudomonas dryadis]TBV06006.1 DUF1302 domain-containing protein [Pseudomonas dryadis]TBV18147.1 DUF1302 domain-containing protein [Pseudomonas sp. FRB 230]